MITVLGLGFVGLTTALGFAEKGFKVYGYDVNKEKISLISNKTLPFHEEGLAEILEKNLNKNFVITNDLKLAIENSKIIFLCVGTPSDEEGKADLKYIKLAIDDILNNLSGENKKIIVIKSTIPPSTTKKDIRHYIENSDRVNSRMSKDRIILVRHYKIKSKQTVSGMPIFFVELGGLERLQLQRFLRKQ